MYRLASILRESRRWLGLAVIALVTLASGCKQIDALRGEGYVDADAEWGKKYRPTGAKGERFFFDDEKASQIERSLGL